MTKKRYIGLTGQLIIACLIIVTTLVVFFSGFFTDQIKGYIYNQTISVIQISHNSIKEDIEYKIYTHETIRVYDNVEHVVLNDKGMVFHCGSKEFPNDVLDKIYKQIKNESTLENLVKMQMVDEYYYVYSRLIDGDIFITIADGTLSNSLKSGITDSLLLAGSIFFLVVLCVLIFWTLRIIVDLLNMRKYVNSVKNGQEGKLLVKRNDEIGDLANDLVNLELELKSQEALKEEMIHNISHDLKTPIATIKSYAESIKDGIYPYDSLEKSVDVIIDNATRLEGKVHNLLMLNRVDYIIDQTKGTEYRTNMSELVKMTVNQMKVIKPQIDIVWRIDDDVYFLGENEPWHIVVENLLDNALRHTKSYIMIDLQQDCLVVENDGEKIEEDMLTKLFKPYEKGNKGKFGLGLSICYKICKGYNYKISAENLTDTVAFTVVFDTSSVKKKG